MCYIKNSPTIYYSVTFHDYIVYMYLKTFISCWLLSFGYFNLFSEITREELLYKKLISWEVDSKIYDQLSERNQSIVDTIIERLLKSKQGQFLLQALIYQRTCLEKAGLQFSIHVRIGTSEEGSNTVFLYDDTTKTLSVTITLATCEHKLLIQTIRRPILVKQNDFYRLYQLEIPDFIILAHELLHALNHAELFASQETQLKTLYQRTFSKPDGNLIFRRNAIQKFLCKKLLLTEEHFILKSPYKDFWENPYPYSGEGENLGDALDEMTTILCSFHAINEVQRVRIGETLLLREYYPNYENLISWSHYIVEEHDPFRKNDILLFPKYVDRVLNTFALVPQNISESEKMKLQLVSSPKMMHTEELIPGFIYGYTIKKRENMETNLLIPSNSLKYNFIEEQFSVSDISLVGRAIMGLRTDSRISYEFSREEILREVFPKAETFIMLPRKINFDSFGTLDVPSDGNCAFWAILIASGILSSPPDAPGASDAMKDLRSKVADLAATANVDPDFVSLLRTPGRWNAGIHGGVGLEALHYIARHLGQQIILIENEGGIFSYWDSRENNLVLHAIEQENIGVFLETEKAKDKDIIFIYHESNHFQAIVKK